MTGPRDESGGMDSSSWQAGLASLEALMRAEFGTLRAEIGTMHGEIGTMHGEIATMRGEIGALREEMLASDAETRRYIDEKVAENRRHFQVLAEEGLSQFRLLGEGIDANRERLDRFETYVHREFERADQRLLRIEDRLAGPAAR